MIDEILDFSRLQAAEVIYSRQPFDLAQTCRQVIDLLRPLATEKRLSLQLEWSPELRPGREGDQQKVRQVLISLIGNALKFTDSGSVRLKV